jgi:hypothetical protein
MKRILGILAIVALVAMTVQAVEVKSENVAGVVQTTVPAGAQVILGVNLDSFDPADQNLLGILGGQIAQGTQFNSDIADHVVMWDNASSSYKTYGMHDDEFYSLDDWAFGSPTNPAVVPGEGFWLKSNGGQIDLSLTGQAVESSDTTMRVYEGLQFLAYPFSCVRDIQDTGFDASGAKRGTQFDSDVADQIVFWTGSAYKTYGLRENGSWYDLDDWAFGSPVTDVVLDLAEGFWYKRVTGEGYFDWTEENPYDQNL